MRILFRKKVFCGKPVARAGEGGAVLLRDGRVLFACNRLDGNEDYDPGELYGGYLDPETGAISEDRIFFAAPGACNQMSVNFERLPDGGIGFIFGRKSDANTNEIFFSRSYDEGKTWQPLRSVSGAYRRLAPYFVLNNDRLRVLANGRLALPVCIYYDGFRFAPGEPKQESDLALFLSDDNGDSWRLSSTVPTPDAGQMPLPPRMAPGGETLFDSNRNHEYRFQEPGVELLADGRVLLYCRTLLGYMYQAYSADNGEHFSTLAAAKDIVSPCSPQSIRRAPGGNRLYCVYNDHRDIPYSGEPPWTWRTPLSLAVSDDHGSTYKPLGEVEDTSHNYCYASMTFLPGNRLLLTDYESENLMGKRRNLAFLKLQLIELQ